MFSAVYSRIQPYTAVYTDVYCILHVWIMYQDFVLDPHFHIISKIKKFDPCTFSLLLFLFSLPHISRAWMIYIGSLIQETVDVTLAREDDLQIEAHNPKPLTIV